MTSIPLPIVSAALARPDHPAVIAKDKTVSYRALRDRALHLAGGLAARGAGPGRVVALLGPLDDEWIACWHAIGACGAIAAPLFDREPLAALGDRIAALTPELIVTTAGAPAGLSVSTIAVDDLCGPLLPERFWPLEEPRVRLLTSGSLGSPKVVTLSTAQIVFSALGSAARLGHHLDDRWLLCLPVHHVGGLSVIVRCALLSTTIVLGTGASGFDPRFAARLLDRGGASLVSLVPSMFGAILDARPKVPFPSSLRVILLGGDAAPPSLLDRAREIGAPVATSWGMTECASQIATAFPGQLEDGVAGPPTPFARIFADQSVLVVRGPIAPGGELVTNDVGSVNPSGAVAVWSRRDAVFISGGENVDPARVEAVLREHPVIDRALVVGVPDSRWGRRAAALLVGAETRPSDEEIIAWCKQRLAPAEVPASLRWVEALPLGDTGKPSRGAAIDLFLKTNQDTAAARSEEAA